MNEVDFNDTWERIIRKKCISLSNQFGGLVCLEDSRKEVHLYYEESVAYAKNHYMTNPDGLLNRYKVAAALMIAVLKAKPIKKASPKFYRDPSDKWIFNEQLALYTGLMVVRDFILAEVNGEGGPRNWREEILLDKFSASLPLVKADREKWEIELYYLRQEGSYQLLSLAHELEDFVEKVVLRTRCELLEQRQAICSEATP